MTPLGTRLCRPSDSVPDPLPDPQRAADPALFDRPSGSRFGSVGSSSHAPRFLMLYGSLRERSYSQLLTRDVSPYLVDRYSKRRESAAALSKRVNQQSI